MNTKRYEKTRKQKTGFEPIFSLAELTTYSTGTDTCFQISKKTESAYNTFFMIIPDFSLPKVPDFRSPDDTAGQELRQEAQGRGDRLTAVQRRDRRTHRQEATRRSSRHRSTACSSSSQRRYRHFELIYEIKHSV
jgi:hypothetical protein